MTLLLRRHTGRIFRRLLQADLPVPPRTDAEIRTEQEANFRWNLSVNFIDGAFFWIGVSFISYTTILPLFASKLTTHPLVFAVIAIIGQAGWYLPQLFAAGPTEKLARKKPVVIHLGFFTERLPVWFLPIAALLAPRSPSAALLILLLAYAAHSVGAGVIAPAWSDMLARCFPVARRGRFFGITAFVGTGLGALAALLSGWLLDAYAFPTNFVIIFALAALFITLSWAALAFVREPVQPLSPAARNQNRWSGTKIKAIVRGDANFRAYLVARLLRAFGNLAAGFITVSAIQRWAVSDSTIGLYTAALLIGQTLGNLLAGFIADRFGHKLSFEMGALAIAAAFFLAWLAPSPLWYFVVFVAVGIATGITIVSGVLINMEFSLPEHRPTYIGIGNTTAGIGSVAAPLLGGLLAFVSYDLMFAISGLFGILAFVVLRAMVQEPRQQTEFFDL